MMHGFINLANLGTGPQVGPLVEMLQRIKPLLFPSVVLDVLRANLQLSNRSADHVKITINRRKAIRHKVRALLSGGLGPRGSGTGAGPGARGCVAGDADLGLLPVHVRRAVMSDAQFPSPDSDDRALGGDEGPPSQHNRWFWREAGAGACGGGGGGQAACAFSHSTDHT